MKSFTEYVFACGPESEELESDIRLVVDNPVTRQIMQLAGGMVVVLNTKRQIVASNRSFQQFLGMENDTALFGKRPGEAVGCEFSTFSPDGCGASLQCGSCDIMAVIRRAIEEGGTVERRSALQLNVDKGSRDLCLQVRGCPIEVEGHLFVILNIIDITNEEKQRELNRIFQHDILNTALGISAACTMIDKRFEQRDQVRHFTAVAKNLSARLMKDLRVHRVLGEMGEEDFTPTAKKIDLKEFLGEFREIAGTWPQVQRIQLEMDESPSGLVVETDPHLLYRVLLNMLLNACEATDDKCTVRIWAERAGDYIKVNTWNREHIPEKIAARIFHRHFSTKSGRGRGVGTFSMKYITEKFLGGKLSFTSTRENGTVFSLTIR